MIDEFVKKMQDFDTNCEIWSCLEGYFLSHSRARIMHYNVELSAIKKESMSISEYMQHL